MRMRSRGVSNCSGPYHAASSAGSVQALNTLSRGASKMRVISTCSFAAPTGVDSFILLSFPAKVRVQSVHPRLPRLLARLHPLDRLVERLGLHLARPPLRVTAAGDQAGAFQHLQVARNRGQAHRQRLRQLAHGRLALRQAREYRAPSWVGESGEREAELIGRHVTCWLINVPIKYDLPSKRNSGNEFRRVRPESRERAARKRTRASNPRPSAWERLPGRLSGLGKRSLDRHNALSRACLRLKRYP